MADKIKKTDEEWRAQLTDEQYRITRKAGTERAFSGEYYDNKAPGEYRCIGCGEMLFDSDTKYDSGSGWPSFTAPAKADAVGENHDESHGMIRTEVVCSRCDAHLGHKFPDGPPQEGGMRYCINSAALDFKPSGDEDTPSD